MAEGEEKERSRIAHDLHDGAGDLLSTLKMYFGILKKRVPELSEFFQQNMAFKLREVVKAGCKHLQIVFC
jgi:signal transduction histidine kinase